jgi:hypothetical protein
MDFKPVTSATPRDERETSWQRSRREIDKQWEAALQSEISAIVPEKLPISIPPVRYAA